MLKISTKTRYAFRTLLEMACSKDIDLFNLDDLSRHQNISRKYLENIFTALRKNGIVSSKVGKNGGFYLAKNLKKISLLMILEALEGKIDIVKCRGPLKNCNRLAICPARQIWQQLNNSIKEVLASKNLMDLSRKKNIRQKNRAITKLSYRPKKTKNKK